MKKLLCHVYKSTRKEGMYLYVLRDDALARVPEALLEQFGTPQMALTMVLTPEKRLARMRAGQLIAALEDKGFYLQMPLTMIDDMSALHEKNDKF